MQMAITLQKGGNLSLSKADPTLVKILIGLGWDERATDGTSFDLDASAFLLNDGGKVRSDADLIFYNQLKSVEGAVEHTGDNRSGAGDGDDESIKVNLSLVPANVHRIAVTVTIHDAEVRRQSFGQIANAFIRVVNDVTGAEIVRYDLAEDYSTETAMVFGELYRHGAEWKFRAVGQGYAGGLRAVCNQFGIKI
jgi:tellurium resistance protein TerD